jgi:CrcB protein
VRWLVIFLGGGLGATARYALGGWVQALSASFFPWGTFAVNALGCFAIGALATLLEERSALGPNGRLFLLVGVLGGFTTFSTFGFETWRLLEAGDWPRAAGNVVGSTGVGLAAVVGGVALARSLA